MALQQLVMHSIAQPTPFAFLLMVERFPAQLSNKSIADRIARMAVQLENAAGGAMPVDDVGTVRATLACVPAGRGGQAWRCGWFESPRW